MNEFAGAETVNVDRGKLGFDVMKLVQIPLERQLRMMAALQQYLRPAQGQHLLDLTVYLRVRDHISVGVLLRSIKGAEFAENIADVGIIYISVNLVSDNPVASAPKIPRLGQLPPPVGQHPQLLQPQAIQTQGFRTSDTRAAPDLFQQ